MRRLSWVVSALTRSTSMASDTRSGIGDGAAICA